MPRTKDFRLLSNFSYSALSKSGIASGRKIYWKLYAIENILRVIIHSVLSQQINASWWATAVDNTIKLKAARFKTNYTMRPWHSSQGSHDIYFVDLADLNEIIRANRSLFDAVIADLDQWLLRVESVRLPRNVVAHMNYPTKIDEDRIGVVHADFIGLLTQMQKTTPSLVLSAPA